jgi:hypothetical protein
MEPRRGAANVKLLFSGYRELEQANRLSLEVLLQ